MCLHVHFCGCQDQTTHNPTDKLVAHRRWAVIKDATAKTTHFETHHILCGCSTEKVPDECERLPRYLPSHFKQALCSLPPTLRPT